MSSQSTCSDTTDTDVIVLCEKDPGRTKKTLQKTMSSQSSRTTDDDVIVLGEKDGGGMEKPSPIRFGDSDVEEEENVVWSKGDKCLAYYYGDEIFYEAHIIQLVRRDGEVKAVVHYDGYESEENEELNLKQIKRIPRRRRTNPDTDSTQSPSTQSPCTSMFSPLSGRERDDDMRKKFADLDDQYSAESIARITNSLQGKPKKSGQKSSQKRRAKGTVVQGGEEKKKGKSDEVKVSPRIAVSQNSSRMTEDFTEDSTSQNDTSGFEGFDDGDMEKPRFSHTASHLKVPLVLSHSPLIQVPATFNQYLRDYQREGVKFLYLHYKQGRGAILGDDMGLGKTVQVIAFLAALLKKTGTKEDVMRMRPRFIRQLSDTSRDDDETPVPAFLIVCPGSVLYNWADELETWGHFKVACYHLTAKSQTLASLKKGKLEIVLTTFDTFRENFDELDTYSWNAVIVDEAHKIKGLKAQVTEALRSIRTKCRYGLTGTALQNNMTELWAILDWANPGCLGTYYSFTTNYVKKIERGQKQDATKRELAEARKSKEKFSSLRAKWMLRRTKALIADQIPRKDDQVVYCKLTDFQTTVYEAILDHEDVKLVLTKHKPCVCGSGATRGSCCFKRNKHGFSMKSLMFSYLHLLLKTANHAALLIPGKTVSEKQQQAAEEICDVAFEKYPEFIRQTKEASFRTLSDPKYCGKMKVLQGMLSVFKKQRCKVLLFSYSTKLLDILEQYVISVGYEFRRLDGQVSDKKRHMIVREFNRDPDIFLFLISTKAGSLGLNLTGANVVVIFDPNWNPTHDLQAQDRAYRIGQRRDVRVYRLISSGTIEENMYLRQIYKQQLDNVAVATENARRYFHAVQGDKSQRGELFGLENMFHLRIGDKCLTQDILERNKKIETALGGVQVSDYVPPPSEKQSQPEEKETNVHVDSESEVSLTSESDLDFRDLDSESDAEVTSGGEKPSQGPLEEQSLPFTPQEQHSTVENSGESLPDTDASVLDDIFDLFGTRTGKPRHKVKQRNCGTPGEDSAGKNESSDLYSPNKERDETDAPIGSLSRRRAGFDETGAPIGSLSRRRAGFDETDAPIGSLSRRRAGKINLRNGGAKRKDFSFRWFDSDAKTDSSDLHSDLNKSSDTRTSYIEEESEDFHSLLQEFDAAIDSSKNKRKTPKKKQTGSVKSEQSSDLNDSGIEPKPSTSGPTKGRKFKRRVLESSSDEDASQKESAKTKSRKFTKLKISPAQERQSSKKGCDRGKGKGVGKKSKYENGAEDKRGRDSDTSERVERNIELKKVGESFASISDVFDHCGVVHIHENRKVIGASKAEDHMSRCAIQDVFERQQYSQEPAMECDPLSDSEPEDEPEPEPEPKKKKPTRQGTGRQTKAKCTPNQTLTIGNKKVFVGQTPKAIQRLHFSKLVKHYNLSEEEFARKVRSSSEVERCEILHDFYSSQDPELAEAVKIPVEEEEEIPVKKTEKPVRKAVQRKTSAKQPTKRKPTKSSRKGCVFEGSSDEKSNQEIEDEERTFVSKAKGKRQKKSEAFKEAYVDFLGFDSSGDEAEESVKTVLSETDRKSRPPAPVSPKRKDCNTGIPRKSTKQSKADTDVQNPSKDASESFLSVKSRTLGTPRKCSPAAASLLDDLFTAPAKRKAPPKKKAADKSADQSSIFDIF